MQHVGIIGTGLLLVALALRIYVKKRQKPSQQQEALVQ